MRSLTGCLFLCFSAAVFFQGYGRRLADAGAGMQCVLMLLSYLKLQAWPFKRIASATFDLLMTSRRCSQSLHGDAARAQAPAAASSAIAAAQQADSVHLQQMGPDLTVCMVVVLGGRCPRSPCPPTQTPTNWLLSSSICYPAARLAVLLLR